MQIKHTFLFTFVLGLVWTGYLFAYVLGPEPARNGSFGTNCTVAGCHTGNQLNAAGGSVTLNGLPSAWTPGQTYPLSVTIQRTNAKVFGFQLSAVVDATNQQAGTLAPGNNRVEIVCGRNTGDVNQQIACDANNPAIIQYAEHSNATVVTSTYIVNWTAPATAVGTVRFNVAGNAGNGDLTNQGDFIYTRVDKVDPSGAPPPPPPPPPPDLSVRAYTMVDRGGVSVITDGSGDLSVGYSRIQPDAGSTTPSGVAIFGLRQNGIVVTEAGVPASPRLTTARIYGELTPGGLVNTGIAIANPTAQTANVTFTFTDAAGVDIGSGGIQLAPGEQKAKFLHEDPFNRTSFQGTLTFTSNVEISLIALRGIFNERSPSEFLITTLPVTNLSAAAATGPLVLPEFAEGGGWTTQIVLVNPTDATLTGTVQFFGQGSASVSGAPISITANGQAATSFTYTIPRRSSFKVSTAGSLPSTVVGSVHITPTSGATPSALVVFSFKQDGITVSEAGVPGLQSTAFRMYAEESTSAATVGAIQTGVAIANASATPATATLELTSLDGGVIAQTQVTVPASGQVQKFLHELFGGLSFPVKGVLRITTTAGGGLSVVGLRGRYNERGNFLITTTPPTNENSAASSAEFLFPHLVNGGGYTTQFILFSGVAGQASTGNLKFFKQDGTGLNLTLN